MSAQASVAMTRPTTARDAFEALCCAKTNSAVNYVLRGACWLEHHERHQFAIKMLADTSRLRDKFVEFFEDFLSKGVTADNIDKRHYGSYLEMCAAIGHERFIKAKALVERVYSSVGRKLPIWMKEKFNDLNTVYFSDSKSGHHGPSNKQLQKKTAKVSHDREVRAAMKGKGGGSSGPQKSGGKQAKKK